MSTIAKTTKKTLADFTPSSAAKRIIFAIIALLTKLFCIGRFQFLSGGRRLWIR